MDLAQECFLAKVCINIYIFSISPVNLQICSDGLFSHDVFRYECLLKILLSKYEN